MASFQIELQELYTARIENMTKINIQVSISSQ